MPLKFSDFNKIQTLGNWLQMMRKCRFFAVKYNGLFLQSSSQIKSTIKRNIACCNIPKQIKIEIIIDFWLKF